MNSVSFSTNTLVSGSSDMKIKLWKSTNKTNETDFANFACYKTLIGHEHAVSKVFNIKGT